MTTVVLDASAVLALMFNETGADKVLAVVNDAVISTVNLSEVVTKLVDHGAAHEVAAAHVASLGIDAVAFDLAQAVLAAGMRQGTRRLGLSLGDRACLALAEARTLAVFTADRAWSSVPTKLRIVQIR